MKLCKSLLLLFVSTLTVWAAAPDCSYQYRISNRTSDRPDNVTIFAPGATSSINNQTSGCVGWSLIYAAEGFSALSIQLESASLTNSPSVPGTWTAYSGTTVTGSNPSTNTTSGVFSVSGFAPWVRVNTTTTTGTGSINVLVFGWRSPSFISSTAAFPPSNFFQTSNNLSESTPATVRTNIGVTPAWIGTNLNGVTISGSTANNIPYVNGTNVLTTNDATGPTYGSNALATQHITGISKPTYAFGAGAGTGPTLTQIRGTDLSGFIVFTSGTAPTTGGVAVTITFAQPYVGTESCIITSNNLPSNPVQFYNSGNGGSFINVGVSGTLAATTGYAVYWTCTQVPLN